MKRGIRAGLLAATLAMGIGAPSGVGAAEEFYAGKTITMLIGFGAGGGFDLYARLAARHIGKHIPGNPTVIPKNMPGGGGITAANYMANVAPTDGSVLATIAEWAALDQVLQSPGIRYDAAKMNWVGRLTSTTTVYYTWHTSPSKTFEDIRNRETVLGSTGRGLTAYLPRAMNRLAGAQFKLISGYVGSRNVMMAMEQGEIEAGFALWSQLKTQQSHLLLTNKVNVVITIAENRHPDLPDVPSIIEMANRVESKQLLRFLISTAEIGRALATTPRVPSDRVSTLRAAFDKMIQDPDFLADANKAKLTLDPAPGRRLQEIVDETVSATPDVRQKLRAAVRADPADR